MPDAVVNCAVNADTVLPLREALRETYPGINPMVSRRPLLQPKSEFSRRKSTLSFSNLSRRITGLLREHLPPRRSRSGHRRLVSARWEDPGLPARATFLHFAALYSGRPSLKFDRCELWWPVRELEEVSNRGRRLHRCHHHQQQRAGRRKSFRALKTHFIPLLCLPLRRFRVVGDGARARVSLCSRLGPIPDRI